MSPTAPRARYGLPTNPRQWLLEKKTLPSIRDLRIETNVPLVVGERSSSKDAIKKPVPTQSAIVPTPIESEYEDLLDCYSSEQEPWTSKHSPLTPYPEAEVKPAPVRLISSPAGVVPETHHARSSSKSSNPANHHFRDSHSSSGSSDRMGMKILTLGSYGKKSFTRKRANYPVNTSLDLLQINPLISKSHHTTTTTATLHHNSPVQRGPSINHWVDQVKHGTAVQDRAKPHDKAHPGLDVADSRPTSTASDIKVESGESRGPLVGYSARNSAQEGTGSWDECDLLEAYSSAWESEASSRDSYPVDYKDNGIQVNVSLVQDSSALSRHGMDASSVLVPSSLAIPRRHDVDSYYQYTAPALVPPLSAKSESSIYSVESDVGTS